MEKQHPGMVWGIFIWTPLPFNYPFFYFAYIHVEKALHMLKHYWCLNHFQISVKYVNAMICK